MLDVYHIVEREGHKPLWTRVGVAFVNRDDSLNIILEAMPIDGRLHVRKRSEKQERMGS